MPESTPDWRNIFRCPFCGPHTLPGFCSGAFRINRRFCAGKAWCCSVWSWARSSCTTFRFLRGPTESCRSLCWRCSARRFVPVPAETSARPRELMMRRAIFSLLLANVFCFLSFSAVLPDKWRSWHYSRPLLGQPSESDGPAELSLPWDIYAHCHSGCDDVRIVNSRGDEVPFVMAERHAAANAESRAARVIENSFVADHYTQVIGDLGEGRLNYDRVQVETNRPDFIVWAEVALSDDARTWRIVEPRAPIARFRSRAVDGTQSIPIEGLSS